MPALWLWWNLLPPVMRRLIGAVLLCGIAAAGLLYWHHRAYTAGVADGKTEIRDSVKVAMAKQFRQSESLHTKRSDSLVALGVLHDSAPPAHGPRVLRIEPTDSLVPIVPLSALVKIYVASDSTPTAHYADRYIADLLVYDDSLIYKNLQPRLTRALAANKQLYSAWQEERAGRTDADSAAHYWQGLYEEHRTVQPSRSRSRTRDAVYATIGAVVALVARNQIHHR